MLFTMMRFGDSIIPHVARRITFWFFFFVHFTIWCWHRSGHLHGANHGSPWELYDSDVKIVCSMSTFFQVFYLGISYKRYRELFWSSRRLCATLVDYSFQLQVYIGDQMPQHARLSVRYFLASVLSFFLYELRENEYTRFSKDSWAELKHQGLVLDHERRFLEPYNGRQRCLLLLQWSARIMMEGCHNVEGLPSNVIGQMRFNIEEAFQLERELTDDVDLVMPFSYFHLVNVIALVNMTFAAYFMGCKASVFSPFLYFISEIIFMGMLELAVSLHDPFRARGTLRPDFDVPGWVAEHLEMVVKLSEAVYSGEQNHWKETLEHEVPLQRKWSISLLGFDSSDMFSDVVETTGEIDGGGGCSWYGSRVKDPCLPRGQRRKGYNKIPNR
jgi:hypothetical protein